MKLYSDPESDALYLRLNDSKIIGSEEVVPGVILDFDDSEQVVGVEILHLSKRTLPVDLSKILFETNQSAHNKEVVARESPEKYGAPRTDQSLGK
jgi:uncharacterized protein YuzE